MSVPKSSGFNLGRALPTLHAPRVRLRWLRKKDVAALFVIFGDAEVTRYWGHGMLPNRKAAAALLEDIREQFAQQRLYQWGVALRGTDVVIGTCTLASLSNEHRRAELGFALGRPYWGHGYMDEALRTLLRFAFCDMQLHRVTADTDPRNKASIRILETLGFRREGFLREHYLVAGKRQDSILYGLLRSDWEEFGSR